MEEGVLVGLVSIIFALGVLPLSTFYFIHLLASRRLDTIVKIVELGGNIDIDMMKLFNANTASYKTDYKFGMIWLAIGIPVFVGVWLHSGMAEAVFGAIPAFIGIAYIISGKYRLRDSA